jgi:hypothetical protein
MGDNSTMSRLRAFLLLWLMSGAPPRLCAAGPAGVWEGQLTMTGGAGEAHRAVRLKLVVSGSKLTGTLTGAGTASELLDGAVHGDEVSFAIASGASDVPRLEFHGRIDGDEIKFEVTGQVKGTEKAEKLGAGSFHRGR